MKFALFGVSLVGAATALSPRQTPATYPLTEDCRADIWVPYRGVYDKHGLNLLSICYMDTWPSTDIWANKYCVAAAISNEVENVLIVNRCGNGNWWTLPDGTIVTSVPPRAAQKYLDYNIWASIVGDCAWAEGGCPMTKQNYVDFYYRTIETAPIHPKNGPLNPKFPQYDLVVKNWNHVLEWTKTGDTVPYTNFNDFLLFSTPV